MTGDESDRSEESTTDVVESLDAHRPPPDVLEIEPVYEALAHSRRRYVCYTLLERTQWSLRDLAVKIAAWENDVPERAVTDDQREAVYVSLYHAHIPKLVEEGVIVFDETTELVSAGEHADQVLAALDGMGSSLDAEQEAHARSEIQGGDE